MLVIYRNGSRCLFVFLAIAVLAACRGTITTTSGQFPTIPGGQLISLHAFSGFAEPYQLFSLQQAFDGAQSRVYFAQERRQSPYNETYSTIDSIRSDGTTPTQYHFSGTCHHAFSMTSDGAHFLCTDGQQLLLAGRDGDTQQLTLTEGMVKSVAITPDGSHVAMLAHADSGDYLTIADLSLAPLSLQPRLRLALPVITAEDVYPVVSWSPDGRWLMLHRENQPLFFQMRDLSAAFAPPGVTPPSTALDYAQATLLPASGNFDPTLSSIAWGATPDEVIVTDSQHLIVSALNLAQPGGGHPIIDLTRLRGSVMIHQMVLAADGKHLDCVIGYPYYGFNDANPAPYNPSDRLYVFAL